MMNFDCTEFPQYRYVVPRLYTRANIRLIGLGIYIPTGMITNEFFAYISTRLGDARKAQDIENATGLQTRRVRSSTLAHCRKIAGNDAPGLIDDPAAPREETLADMAVIAAQQALASAGRKASEIDTIIATSSTDNDAFPTIAGLVQMKLGCQRVRASTLRGACACEAEAFQMAADALVASTARLVLIVSSDAVLANTLHVLDWRASSLFGEGASALLLERGSSSDDETFITNGYDARQASALSYQTALRKDVIEMVETDLEILRLYRDGCGEAVENLLLQPHVGYAHMSGRRVYEEAPRAMAECVDMLCRHAHITADTLAHIIPHQANSRLVQRIGELLILDYGWPASTMEKLADHFRHYGNLSNASIGLALSEILRAGRLLPGQWMALPTAGGGMHYGCWLLRYQAIRHPDRVLS